MHFLVVHKTVKCSNVYLLSPYKLVKYGISKVSSYEPQMSLWLLSFVKTKGATLAHTHKYLEKGKTYTL